MMPSEQHAISVAPNQLKKNSQRLLELDALRGLAALAVLLFHYTKCYGELYGPSQKVWFSVGFGNYGVMLFFMISGFVILMTLDRTKTIMDFVVARFCRLYPVYWVAVITTFTLLSLYPLPDKFLNLKILFLNLTMVQKLFNVPDVDGVYWSLLRELFFYIVAGTIFALGLRRYCNSIFAALIVYGLAIRLSGIEAYVYVLRASGHILVNYLHLFLLGIILYQMRCSGWQWKQVTYLTLCFITACARYSTQDLMAFFILAGVMFVATQFPIGFLTQKTFGFLGIISYSLYLIHRDCGFIIIKAGCDNGLNVNLSIIIAILAALTMAGIMTFTIERPVNMFLRNKYKQWKAVRLPKPVPVLNNPTAYET